MSSHPKSPIAYSPPSVGRTTAPPTPVVPTVNVPSQPHLVSLVVQSKKALQHGEQLCTRAHTSSNESAQASVDVLALDAKVRWIVEAVVEQLQLAASVAKTIEEKRTDISRQANEWDIARTQQTDALDAILESLGAQLVPPEFHQHSSDSSLFGSQHSADLENERLASKGNNTQLSPAMLSNKKPNGSSDDYSQLRSPISPVSPSATLRRNGSIRQANETKDKGRTKHRNPSGTRRSTKEERKRWKTLRDFVDDQAIETVLETIENDRSALEEIISKTDDYPETLTRTIHTIRSSLPFPNPDEPDALKRTQQIVVEQEHLVNSMASLLESLASHYDGMANALKDSENGEDFSDEDLQVMNRDTDELPAIMRELEDSLRVIEEYHLEKDLKHLSTVLDDLDELGEIMSEMLHTQEILEVQANEELIRLHDHLTALESTFHIPYVEYRTAFTKLLLEIERRRQYKEAAENIVSGMMKHLESMTEEETRVREHFNKEYGGSLPLDLCLYVANSPTRWEIVPWQGTTPEALPHIDNDLLAEARAKVASSDGPLKLGHDSQ
ncbi:Autophagy-related protein 17 [Psilocybe cubensis]|uniref:Autophagy-related protein 17 n=2 Tax=Psilocybe cubensis TaxID=181762 RepID=A0A8H8CL16_PSICU|nr:Autophagy-related protein 17 [Psilocybe cubensis]KAH9481618.1 Autophagy-related protein 17 [Psilocybe cubensis]